MQVFTHTHTHTESASVMIVNDIFPGSGTARVHVRRDRWQPSGEFDVRCPFENWPKSVNIQTVV